MSKMKEIGEIEENLSKCDGELKFGNEIGGQVTQKIESALHKDPLTYKNVLSDKTEELQNASCIISEEFKEENQLAVKLCEQNGITKLEIDSCKNFAVALNFLNSPSFEDQLKDSINIFLVKFLIDEIFEELNGNEMNKLSEKCRNNSIVIFFASKCAEKFSIYWKSKELDYFLTMKPYAETFSKDDEEVYEFMAHFFANSLKNGHLGLNKNYQLSDETNRIDTYHISDSRGYNLLLLASEAGKVKVTVHFLKVGLDLMDQEQTVNLQELALQNGHYNVIMALYKEDIPLPGSIDIDGCPEEFKNFIQKLEEFNRMIIEDNLETVKEIFHHLPRSNYFYNSANESALKIATKNRAFKCYDFFLSEYLRFAPHEPPEEYYEELHYDDQRIVREIHYKYTQELQEKHINILLSKSFLSHDVPDSRKKLKIVQKAYRALNANALIKIILMIVAASKKFKIIFDFNRDAVNVADPTATPDTQGIFYVSGRIYIGAKQLLNESTAHETLATIAHELCHFAMNLVYNNKANPYKSNDNQTIQEFEEISRKCEAEKEKEIIIGLVYGCYPEDMYHAELIVRVVHLLALYRNQPDKLAEVRGIFGPLFDFYEKKVVPEMREALPEIDGRAEKEIKKKDKKISKLKRISIISGILAILGVIGAVFVGFILHKPTYSFDKLPRAVQIKVENATVNYKNVQVQFRDLFPLNSSIYVNLTSDHISKMLERETLDFSDTHLHYLDEQVRFNWGNLTDKLKYKFLSSNFTFQNESLKFERLVEKTSKAFDSLTSEQIVDALDGKILIVGKLIPNKTAFYIERKIRDENINEIFFEYIESEMEKDNKPSIEKFFEFYINFVQQNTSIYSQKINEIRLNSYFKSFQKYESDSSLLSSLPYRTFQEYFEEALEESTKSRIYVLSSEAGAGKTTTFEQFSIRIKEKFPVRWVSYIDMKDFTRFYNKNESLGNVLGLLGDILELNSKNGFKRKIFEELFKSGEVILFWNGFDEISPTYSDFILNLLDLIHKTTNNTQFICTRPLYSELLRSKFGNLIYSLVPLDKAKQEEFLTKFFISVKIDEDMIKNYTEKVFKIVNALTTSVWSQGIREGFNTPLMLEMIAGLISNDVEIYNSENLWEIYEKFIKIKIKIWEDKSGFAKKFTGNSLTDHRKFDMMRMYQMYALKSELSESDFNTGLMVKMLKIMRLKVPKELTSAEISRMGILYINGEDNFKFAHKTFAEFFVAQFFIENIYNADFVDPEDAVLIIQLFLDVTRNYEQTQEVITNFMISFLQLQNNKENEVFDMKIVEIFESKFANFFLNLLWRKTPKIFELLFNFFKKDHKLLINLLQVDENETFYTASYNSAFSDNELDRKGLKELGKIYLSEEEFEKFLNGKNQKGIILFSLYLFRKKDNSGYVPRNRTVFHDKYDLDENILDNRDETFAFESITKNLAVAELKELFLSPSSPVVWKELDSINVDKLWNIAQSLLTRQEQKTFISDSLHKISTLGFSNSFSFFLNKSAEILSNFEIFEIFMNTNILHRAASRQNLERFRQLWNFFIKYTNESQQSQILLRDVDGECFDSYSSPNQKCYNYPSFNILHIILIFNYYGEQSKIEYSTELYEKYFNKSEMQEIILKSNHFLPYFIQKNDAKLCGEFANYLKKLFHGRENELKKIILEKIKNTNLNIFEVTKGVENHSDKLKPFSDLL